MKSTIKRIMPRRLLPVVQRAYWNLKDGAFKSQFYRDECLSTSVLKCVISYNKYGGYCVPESSMHRPAAQKILANDVYEPKTIEFLMAHCRGAGDVIHAGTYFGDFLPAMSFACNSGSKIWAFEPNPENYKCAKITTIINELYNVELVNAGLGAQDDLLWIQTSDENGKSLGGGSKIIPNKEIDVSDGVISVEIKAIDQLIPKDRPISVIQLDVEGYEKEALIGALETIRRCCPILVLEVLPESTLIESGWFDENVLSLGYQLTETIHGNSVFTCAHL